MSRELKFRAWNKIVKKMIYNIQDAYDTLGWTNEEGEIGYPCSSFGDFLSEGKFEVMQYTGLKDKNGKEIYEGDILEYAGNLKIYDKIKVVEWIDKAAFIGFLIARNIEYEIIGNIYENSELI